MERAERGAGRLALRLLLIAAAAMAMLIACGVFSAQPVHAESNFYITDYNIDMQVNEDDTYLITETIDVHFTAPSHGIYRTIPYKIHLDRDGQMSDFYGKVTDFKMLSDQPYTTGKGDSAYSYKIGDPDKYAQEDTTYKLSYVFDMRGDHLKDADEVYYNLVGNTWEAQSIDHVTATVTFPKDIDMNNVGVKTGYDVDVPFEPEGSKVVKIDTTENTLGGLTIRAVLPQGYFTKQASSSNMLYYILIAILAAVTAFGFILWTRYGRDPQIVETEEFYPPEGLNAAEVGYLDTGEVKGEHVTSMLLELADKGYLKITEREVPAGIRKKKTKTEYVITMLKDYQGDSLDEQAFMDGLFEGGSRQEVEMSDLKDSFYKTVNEIKKGITDRYKNELYDSKAKGIAQSLRLIGLLAMVVLVVVSKCLNGSPFFVDDDFLIYLVFDGLEILLPLLGFLSISKWINKPQKKVFKFILGFIGGAIMILLGFGIAVLFDTCMGAQIFPYFIGLVMVFLLYLMAALCERMTDDYAETLGKIRGYKRFLKLAEKERMEMLAEQDPGYYYKNLAFAFALGVTAVYAKNFASLAKEPPQWYESPYYYYGMGNAMGSGSAFDPGKLTDSLNSMMTSVSSSMTSSPSSSGGGGSFSGGGGAGGGGGGSW